MFSKKLLEIESSIRSLSLEEQQWLLERIRKQIQERNQLSEKFADTAYLEAQIKTMAKDPDIQTEIVAINEEFSVTEMDGLSGL